MGESNRMKNMKLVSYDGGKIWYPEFYDMDTVLGLNNTGFLVHDSDIEVEEGIFMTTGSKLWQKLRLLFQAELREEYAKMRLSRFTVDNFLKYLHGTQISKIPEVNYNHDAKVKYLNFGAAYLFACHGNRLNHIKKWLRERLVYVDTLMGYSGSTSDFVTIRANKLGDVSLWLETYIPMYLTVKWRDVPDVVVGGQVTNPGKTVKRVGRNQKVRFDGFLNTATDQNVVIYAGRYLKSVDGISELRPGSLLLGAATKLTKIECHSDLLIESSVSDMVNLKYINFKGCKKLGDGTATEAGQKTLDLTKCRYLRKVDISDTALTALDINIDGGSLEELIYPVGVQNIILSNQSRLKVVGLPNGYRNILRDSEVAENSKYVFSKNINTFLANISSDHITFKNPINVVSNITYKVKMPVAGGNIIINEFDILNNLLNIATVNMTGKALADYTPTPETSQIVVIIENTGGWTVSDMKSCVIDLASNIDVYDECVGIQNIKLLNCPGIERFSQYKYPVSSYQFEPLKNVQNLSIVNSLSLDSINFKGLTKLRKLELSSLPKLQAVSFNDMGVVGTAGVLEDVKIADCKSVQAIQLNVSGPSMTVPFTNSAVMDISALYTLKSIVSNTPIIGLEKIILNRDIENVLFSNQYEQPWDSSIKNLWSYFSASDNRDEGYVGVDFKDLHVKNIDLTATRKIPNAKNFNIAPVDCFKVNNSRDNVIYPFLPVNGVIDLTNFTGNCANMFKNADLRNTTFVMNKDFTQTNFSSMFEGAIIGNCDLLPILSRIKGATDLSFMFKDSDITYVHSIITENNNANITSMYENCLGIKNLDGLEINGGEAVSIFKGCSNITSGANMVINVTGSLNSAFQNCIALANLDHIDIRNCRSANSTFKTCRSLVNMNLALPRGCFDVNSAFSNCLKLESCNIIVPEDVIDATDMFLSCAMLSNINYDVFRNARNLPITLTRMFKGCKKLTHDIHIPMNTIDCSNMFADNLAITHIVKNWEVPFLYNITATNCYFGCNNIEYMNDVYIKTVYTDGLDEIPVGWGGFGYLPEVTGIYEFIIPSMNYKIDLPVELSDNLEDLSVRWGDGTITYGDSSRSHTYNYPGTYIVKGKIRFGGNNYRPEENVRNSLKKVYQLPAKLTNWSAAFKDCIFLTHAHLDNWDCSKVNNFNYFFQGCSNLIVAEVANWDLLGCTYMHCTFDACVKLPYADVSKWDMSNKGTVSYIFRNCQVINNLDVSKWDISKCYNISNIFENCFLLSAVDVSNWNTSKVSIFYYLFCNCRALTYIDVSRFNTENATEMQYMFNGCWSLTSINVRGFNTANVKYMEYMFGSCKALTSIDVTTWNTTSTIRMHGLFAGCELLTSININSFNTDNCTHLGCMFDGCLKLGSIRVSHLNTSRCTYMAAMFRSCVLLTNLDVSTFNTARVTDMQSLFENCKKLTSLNVNNFDTSNVTNFYMMFRGCLALTALNVNNFNTASATNISYMFSNCTKLTTLSVKHFNTSNVTSSHYVFQGCSFLTTLDLGGWDMRKSKHIAGMFESCTSLESINFTGWNTSSVEQMYALFNNTPQLREVIGFENFDYSSVLAINSMFQDCPKLAITVDFTTLNKGRDYNLSHTFYNSKITEIRGMENLITTYLGNTFYAARGLRNLNLTTWDTTRCTNIGQISWPRFLTDCNLLETLNIENFSSLNAQDFTMTYFGNYCPVLTTASIKNCNLQPKNISYMFQSCYELHTLDLSGIDVSLVPDMSGSYRPLASSPKLVNLIPFKNIRTDLELTGSNIISVESMVAVMNELIATEERHVIRFGSANVLRLTPEQIAIATSKNWTVM